MAVLDSRWPEELDPLMRRIVGMFGAAAAALLLSACGPATLAEQWDGTSWTINPTDNPASWTYSTLVGVSCTAASACMALGTYETGSGSTATGHPLSEQWNGTSWIVQPISQGAFGVSCTSAAACTAVGSLGAERWDGTSWTVQTTPLPNPQATNLFAVSCASATACTAVGDYLSSANNTYVSLVERWDGTSWFVQPTPNPAGSVGDSLSGVSCTSATACIAVGYYRDSATNNAVPLAERWDGTSWTIQTTPNPAGSASTELNGVSCTSATVCTAVGYYNGNGTAVNSLQLVERWDGTSWTVQATPQQGSLLNGVSCTSATACAAVGSYMSSGNTIGPPLAEVWDGTSWTTQTIPNQPGKTSSALNAISCTSVSACAAVGNYN